MSNERDCRPIKRSGERDGMAQLNSNEHACMVFSLVGKRDGMTDGFLLDVPARYFG